MILLYFLFNLYFYLLDYFLIIFYIFERELKIMKKIPKSLSPLIYIILNKKKEK